MAINESVAATFPSHASMAGSSSSKRHHETFLMVQWALAIACAYLVLFSEEAVTPGFGSLVIVAFLASNLVVGRMGTAAVTEPHLIIGIAVVDAVLIALSLYVAGQLSVELVVLCLAILIFAIAGFRLASIAGATLGLSFIYLLLVWFGGTESLARSATLLRVPFLFSAAIAYAWLVEVGRAHAGSSEEHAPAWLVEELAAELKLQIEAVKRGQNAVAEGSKADAVSALNEIAGQNQAMLAKLGSRQG